MIHKPTYYEVGKTCRVTLSLDDQDIDEDAPIVAYYFDAYGDCEYYLCAIVTNNSWILTESEYHSFLRQADHATIINFARNYEDFLGMSVRWVNIEHTSIQPTYTLEQLLDNLSNDIQI